MHYSGHVVVEEYISLDTQLERNTLLWTRCSRGVHFSGHAVGEEYITLTHSRGETITLYVQKVGAEDVSLYKKVQ
jgi:hypothetical protein